MKSFDCGNADLNDFLLNDAKAYASHLLAVTYLLENDTELLAFSPFQMIGFLSTKATKPLGAKSKKNFHTANTAAIILPLK